MVRSINLARRCRDTTPWQLINYKYRTYSSIIRYGQGPNLETLSNVFLFRTYSTR